MSQSELVKFIKSVELSFGKVTKKYRMLPDFLLIGTTKGGSTSLFNYLISHSLIKRPFTKELRFFTVNYKENSKEYRKYFPLKLERNLRSKLFNQPFITGEATPDYFFFPHAPSRIKKVLPDIKLILLLRNPIDRAYSHYFHTYKRGYYDLTFKEAIDFEKRNFPKFEKQIYEYPYTWNKYYTRFSILERGKYIKHLKRWLKFYSLSQFLIIKSEDLFIRPEQIFKETLDFLEVPYPMVMPDFKVYNQNTYEMDSNMRKMLKDYYEPYNQELYVFLGRNFEWE